MIFVLSGAVRSLDSAVEGQGCKLSVVYIKLRFDCGSLKAFDPPLSAKNIYL